MIEPMQGNNRLLIITQVVDKNDPVLGFFHHWLEAFAKRFESIQVICLKQGECALPSNVTVHSLGKETGGNRFLYAMRFVKLAYGLHKEYDAVFIHMNPEYYALAGDFWALMRKPVSLWYNHEVGSIWLRLAQPFLRTIFHTSPYAYPARYKNAKRMPAGIDTELFSPRNVEPKPNSVYFQGRIAPAKRVHVLLEAVRLLRAQGIPATASLVGPEDVSYGKTLRADFKDLIIADAVVFLGPKRNEETPALYASHAVSVNLTADGNFDKTVLESAATETPVLVASRGFSGVIPDVWVLEENTAEGLMNALKALFALKDEMRSTFAKCARMAVIEKHSLMTLAEELALSCGASAH